MENTQTELHTLQQEKTTLEQANNTLRQENTELKNLNATQEHTHQQTLKNKEQEHQQVLKLKDESIHALNSKNTTLTQEYQELKDNQIELESILIDLAMLAMPQDKQDKRLSIKEAKPLLESVRKQMIAINQGLGDLKLFTQEDYRALRALKDEGLSIAGLKKRIGIIEQEAKAYYEKLQEQYKDHLSPSTVQKLKQEHAQALEMKEQSHAKTLETKKHRTCQSLTRKTKEIDALKNENIQKDESINSLKGQITQHTQEFATLKANTNALQQQSNTQAQENKGVC
ncbi:coiled-coil domain-containing protein [Helicobacter labacensis]|uniref:hypothetical protein n=1 Tax=Helicobacter labacensis TaxID=2316079 RepID=UPI000EB4333B|nr:hypothetical protein [Helicobacter labacensis]